MKHLITAAIFCLMMTANANARILEINKPGTVYQGSSTIQLKAELKRRYPGLNLQNKRLLRVVLFAKSYAGNGVAQLNVGPYQSRRVSVPGNRRLFRTNRGYQRIALNVPGRSTGSWQINLRGRIKVGRIAVEIAPRANRPNRPNRPGGLVVRQCGYVLETLWGSDIQKFYAQARGRNARVALYNACQRAQSRCLRMRRGNFLYKCERL